MNQENQITHTSKLDQLEEVILAGKSVECPVVHRFTPGMYIREIFIPAGTLLTSMEHKTAHPFVISQGRVMVSSENEGSVTYAAPFTGITLPGTRRALYAITDVIWTTFHATDLTDVEEIGKAILEPHTNPLIADDTKLIWKDSLPKKIEENPSQENPSQENTSQENTSAQANANTNEKDS